jgi:hypothetical protein
MSKRKTPAALPDIRLSDLLARTVEEGSCLIWTGHATAGKFPQWRINGKVQPARRIVYEAVHGPLSSRMQVGTRCSTLLCVHPDCMVARTRTLAMRGVKKRPGHIANIKLARRGASNLNIDIVRAIRASGESNQEVEARLGLKPGYASRIRTGRCWQDDSNPFAALLPR